MPPFVGAAVNVTFTPAHIVVALAEATTLTGRFGFTVTVVGALKIGLLIVHDSEDISLSLTISPFTRPFVENVVEVCPAMSV